MLKPKNLKCFKCKEDIEDTFALQCASCNKWFHISCVSMGRPKFRSLKDDAKDGFVTQLSVVQN